MHVVGQTLIAAALILWLGEPATGQVLTVADTTTRDIPFASHDGHAMLGRLTLPDTPGLHPVVVMVQTAEAMRLDPSGRSSKGGSVPVFNLYREQLARLNVGFFSYEGRGVHTDPASGRQRLDQPVYNTSTLENKVRDVISAVRLVQQQPGVDRSQILLRGMSEASLLAVETATRIPNEIKAVALTGMMGSTLKDDLVFMMTRGMFIQHQGHWDINRDGAISLQEFEADPKGIRKALPPGVEFATFDPNGDGVNTLSDRMMLSAPTVDALRNENIEGAMVVLKAVAAVAIPDGWLKDHFAHRPMWEFLSQLTMPVGVFHGEDDTSTPASNARALEERVKAAGKANIEFASSPVSATISAPRSTWPMASLRPETSPFSSSSGATPRPPLRRVNSGT